MDHLYVSCSGPIIVVPPFWRARWWAISNILPQVSSIDKIGYLLFQLKIVFSVGPMFSMEFTILVLVSLSRIGFDLPMPLNKFFVLHLCEYLGNESVEGW